MGVPACRAQLEEVDGGTARNSCSSAHIGGVRAARRVALRRYRRCDVPTAAILWSMPLRRSGPTGRCRSVDFRLHAAMERIYPRITACAGSAAGHDRPTASSTKCSAHGAVRGHHIHRLQEPADHQVGGLPHVRHRAGSSGERESGDGAGCVALRIASRRRRWSAPGLPLLPRQASNRTVRAAQHPGRFGPVSARNRRAAAPFQAARPSGLTSSTHVREPPVR